MQLEAQAPVIGIPVCIRQMDDQPFHIVGEKYITAVADAAGGLPLLLPALGSQWSFKELVGKLDGLMMTGSPSNVAVHHYGGAPDRPDSPQDPARDATTLPLIKAALEAGLPLFCICRGFQELNVALGGTLHTQVHNVVGRTDHRAPKGTYEERYRPRHPVRLTPDGQFAQILGTVEIQVNSLHWQGIDRLAPGLTAEGIAPDGSIEAVRVTGARNFALGVQWHPEFRATENPVSLALFQAFGKAARAHARAKQGHRTIQAA
ncbi:MAG: gamma-glutamyl-gamma-aminobutyrate hydrolase family protein [Dongiaceae bacterium]